LFQASVCAATARWRDNEFKEHARPALQWIETIQPSIVTPTVSDDSCGFRMYVPNNSGDLMTAAWARGDSDASMAKFRVEKDVRPTRMHNDTVHFLYPLANGECPHFDVLQTAARSITHLGWGVDMVAGNATIISEEDATKLPGERWLPADGPTDRNLRVPIRGTLRNLLDKHQAFLNRLSKDGFRTVPPLGVFDVVGYRRATDALPRRWAAFAILKPDLNGNRAFGTARRCRDVAAWVRNATGIACDGWPFGNVASFVHGHDSTNDTMPLKGKTADDRFMYLPLPTLIPAPLNRVESIRRVLVATPAKFADRLDFARKRLPGQELIDEKTGEVVGMLNLLPTNDWVLKQYTETSRTWSTVTPVVLPGYDDPDHLRRRLRTNENAEVQSRLLAQLDSRVDGLLRKALRQAGFSSEMAESAQLEWRNVGFRAGVDLARRYCRPENLGRFPAYHVRVRFSNPIRGPIAIGAGRYRGFGLFVKDD
jgi:CRISPR-associated protein Csb2